ncbi:hypothetical protein BYT27DRAFT_7105139 [Phlegmacium glaucopus]|nr:hypothetical protein BYT27DRAFT_7105139 [Phlegmacium glaucopus]
MPVQRQQKITSIFRKNASESRKNTSETAKSKTKLKKPNPPSDIVISIKTPHMDNIVSRVKNHEFRKYNISSNIERMWFYSSAPDQTLRYTLLNGKQLGEVKDEEGLGNSDFNQGLKESKFAYEILHLYKVHTPLTAPELKEKYKISPPQRFAYLPGALADAIVWDEQEMLF